MPIQISVFLPMDTIYVHILMVDTLNWLSIGILLDTQIDTRLSPNVDWVSVEMSIKMLIMAWSTLLINTWPQILPLVHLIFHAYSCVKYLVLFIAADHEWKISMREFVLHYYCKAIPHVSKSRFLKKRNAHEIIPCSTLWTS